MCQVSRHQKNDVWRRRELTTCNPTLFTSLQPVWFYIKRSESGGGGQAQRWCASYLYTCAPCGVKFKVMGDQSDPHRGTHFSHPSANGFPRAHWLEPRTSLTTGSKESCNQVGGFVASNGLQRTGHGCGNTQVPTVVLSKTYPDAFPRAATGVHNKNCPVRPSGHPQSG